MSGDVERARILLDSLDEDEVGRWGGKHKYSKSPESYGSLCSHKLMNFWKSSKCPSTLCPFLQLGRPQLILGSKEWWPTTTKYTIPDPKHVMPNTKYTVQNTTWQVLILNSELTALRNRSFKWDNRNNRSFKWDNRNKNWRKVPGIALVAGKFIANFS